MVKVIEAQYTEVHKKEKKKKKEKAKSMMVSGLPMNGNEVVLASFFLFFFLKAFSSINDSIQRIGWVKRRRQSLAK